MSGLRDETEADFTESLEVTEQSKFDMVYIGIYSPRPGTYGARKYEDNVPTKVKKERRSRLNDVLNCVSAENNQLEVGTTREIIVRDIQENSFLGYSDNMKHVIIEQDPAQYPDLQVGQFVNARIIDAAPFKLYGERVV